MSIQGAKRYILLFCTLNACMRHPFIGIIIVFSLIPSFKTELLWKCCFTYWTVCRIACCQIKLHTALVNLISNLTAEPRPDKMHVRVYENHSETIATSEKHNPADIYFLWPRRPEKNLMAWEHLPFPVAVWIALPRDSIFQGCSTCLFQKAIMYRRIPKRLMDVLVLPLIAEKAN